MLFYWHHSYNLANEFSYVLTFIVLYFIRPLETQHNFITSLPAHLQLANQKFHAIIPDLQ